MHQKTFFKTSAFFNLFIVLSGSLIGYIAWNFTISLVGLTSLIYIAYFFIDKRQHLFLLLFSYALFSSYGMLFGLIDFYVSGYIIGFFLWITAALFTTLPWILLWSKNKYKHFYLFPFVLLLSILPPVGFFNGASPLLSAGIFFPSTGYWGILFYILFIELIAFLGLYYIHGVKKWILTILGILFLSYGQCHQSTFSNAFIYPIDTQYSFIDNNRFSALQRQKELVKKANNIQGNIVLFPEHILGEFRPVDLSVWKTLKKKKTVLAGAHIYTKDRKYYDNVILKITRKSYEVVYRQRLPVPVAMWKPYRNEGANTYLTNPYKTEKIEGEKLAFMICYELFIPYIYLQTMYDKPDYLVAVTNLWWSSSPIIDKIQKHSLQAWSRLFGIDFFLSSNL